MVGNGRRIEDLDVGLVRHGVGFETLNRRGARFLSASIARTTLEQYAADLLGGDPMLSSPIDRISFDSKSSKLQHIKEAFTLLNDVRRRPELLADIRATAVLEQRLLENLLLRTCPASEKESYPQKYIAARRAQRYVLEHFEDVPSLRDLCAQAASSHATLDRGLRELYGLSPLLYLKMLRLSRARKDLRQPNEDTTMTDVALRWGFLELGRFSVQYRQRFGETPSETLAHARGEHQMVGCMLLGVLGRL